MQLEPMYIFIFIGFCFSVFLYYLKKSAYRKSVTFRMYAVRDEFVFLVAQNKISEDSKVFQFYYKRINALLSHAPNIGLDDVLHSLIKMKENNLEGSLKKAIKEAEEIMKLRELECSEVRGAIKSFYVVSQDMMLAHSSTIRFMYFVFIRGKLFRYCHKILPSQIVATLKAIQFAEQEKSHLQLIFLFT